MINRKSMCPFGHSTKNACPKKPLTQRPLHSESEAEEITRFRPLSPQSYPSSPPLIPIDESPTLIPGLSNDIAALILSFVPFSHQARLRPTCKSWMLFLFSKTLIAIRQTHHRTNLSHLICVFPQEPSIVAPNLFDPRTLAWCPVQPMPCNPHVYGLCNFTSFSIGPHLYVIGGPLFDTRSFSIDRPSPSSVVFLFDFSTSSWDFLAPILTPFGSFACAAVPKSREILVTDGRSRHTLFSAAGSRMSSLERSMDGLPVSRAGCAEFFVGDGEKNEFWVMDGYSESRTISRVFPVDERYRDAVVMELKNGNGGCRWREVGDMWEAGERMRLAKLLSSKMAMIAVDLLFSCLIGMLYSDMTWLQTVGVRSHVYQDRPHATQAFRFVVLDGELHVITLLKAVEPAEIRRSRLHTRAGTLYVQIYHPRKKTWRSIITKSPFHYSLDFNTAVMSTICL